MSQLGEVFGQWGRRAPRAAAGMSICLLIALGDGCATGPGADGERASDWEQEHLTSETVVLPAPPVVPAPEQVPVAPAPVPAATRPAEAWIPLVLWCQEHGWAAPRPSGTWASPVYTVSTRNGVCVIRVGSDSARWDGLEVRLGFLPQMMDDQPYIHALDLQKTLVPLAAGAAASRPSTNLTIVIDPGHGGTDSGARSVLGHAYEKDFTLDWARRVEALLADNGWRVFLTRTADLDVPLSNRVTFAEAHKADLFLSLHFNSAAPNDREAGLETYCLTPTGMPSNITRGYGDDPALAFPNNAFDAQNLQLALRVHRALLQVNGRLDRGVRRARFLGVLRGQNRPAVLVEGGYLSNPAEARRIADPAYRQRLAEGIAQAVVENPEARSAKAKAGSRRLEDPTRRAEAVIPKPVSP